MNTQTLKRWGWLAVLLPVILLACGLDVETVLTLTSGLGALGALGQVSVIGDIRQDTTPDDHLVRDVADDLTWLRPDVFPLDTILRRMETQRGMQRAKQAKVEWEEDEILPREDTVDAPGGQAAGSSGASVTVTVDNGSYWRPEDLAYLPDNATDAGAVLLITAVSGNDLTAYRVESGTSFGTVPALADGEKIIRMSNAKEEMSNASGSRATMPVQKYNRTQIFDTVVAISGTRKATENYTEDDLTRSEKQSLYDYRSGIEYCNIFGKRAVISDPTSGKERRFMGGITFFLSSNDLTYTAGSLTESILIDWMKQLFSGNAGSRTRMFFTTPNLTAEIDKILIASGTLQSTRDERVLGVEANRVHSSFGDLLLINHQGMAEMGKSNYGLVLDPANIRRRPLRPMRSKMVTDNDIDGDAEQWLEECTLEVRYEATHAVVRDSATDSFA